MNLFEVLFILLVLASGILLVTAAAMLLSGRRRQAVRILRRYAAAAAIYLVIVLSTSPFAPRRTAALGDPLCFDDWCITIRSVEKADRPGADVYVVHTQLSSRARRAPQRETGVVIYLTDAAGRRYEALPATEDAPLDVTLGPGQVAGAARAFELRPGAVPAGVVIAHEGGFPITWLIIGDGPFRKPPLVPLVTARAASASRP